MIHESGRRNGVVHLKLGTFKRPLLWLTLACATNRLRVDSHSPIRSGIHLPAKSFQDSCDTHKYFRDDDISRFESLYFLSITRHNTFTQRVSLSPCSFTISLSNKLEVESQISGQEQLTSYCSYYSTSDKQPQQHNTTEATSHPSQIKPKKLKEFQLVSPSLTFLHHQPHN